MGGLIVMRRKNLWCMVVLSITLLLGGCGDGGSPAPETTAAPATTAATEATTTTGELHSEVSTKQPYFELSVSPENFKIAGYSCLDGDHLDEVQQAMEQIIPKLQVNGPTGYGKNYGDTGWYYGGVDEYKNEAWVFYWRGKNDTAAYISYSLGNDFDRDLYGDRVYLSSSCDIDMDLSELPDIPFVESCIPLHSSYEEILTLLNLTDLVNAANATKTDQDIFVLFPFESQYGIDCTCLCRPNVVEDSQVIEIVTPEWSMQLGFEKDKLGHFSFWETRNHS